MNLPDAHTHSSTAASGTAPRFICGTSPADWKQVALLAERDEHVTPFFGIHPWFLNPAEWKEEMPRLESLLQKIPHAGVGETAFGDHPVMRRLHPPAIQGFQRHGSGHRPGAALGSRLLITGHNGPPLRERSLGIGGQTPGSVRQGNGQRGHHAAPPSTSFTDPFVVFDSPYSASNCRSHSRLAFVVAFGSAALRAA